METAEEKATESVLLRLTPSELQAIDEARGEEQRTAWIRRLCQGGAKVVRLGQAAIGAPWTYDELPDVAHFINWCADGSCSAEEGEERLSEVERRAQAIQRLVHGDD